MNLSLRAKILSLPIVATICLAAVTGTAVIGLHGLGHIIERSDTLHRALGEHQSADMGHDAIRGDILGLQVAGSAAEANEVIKDLESHIALFQQHASANATVPLPTTAAAAVKAMAVPVQDYIEAARSIAVAARSDRSKVQALRGRFDAAFTAAEGRMAEVTTALEQESSAVAAEKDAVLSRLLLSVGILGTVALAALFSIASFVARRVVTSVLSIRDSLASMADGRWDAIPAIDGHDELAAMANALTTMASSVRAALDAIDAKARDLEAAARALNATSTTMTGEAERTAGQAMQITQGADSVSTGINMVATAATQLSASVQEIASQTGEAATRSAEAVRTTQVVGEAITRLGDSSRQIGEVVKAISSIAGQTNLLALNAAIEAASAGAAGRGFAVVAGEVKSLASQTAGATTEISQRVAAIQADVQACMDAIGRITGIIREIDEGTQVVASAVEEQSATTGDISRTVQDAARDSTQIASEITALSQTANDATAHARSLADQARILTEVAAGLRQAMSTVRR